jgi:hypothetical protein
MKLIASRAIASTVSGTGPAGGRYAGVIEQDDLAVGGEGAADSGVVVVQVAHEMVEEHQRSVPRVAETAVGEPYPVGLGEQGRRRVLHDLRHNASVPAAARHRYPQPDCTAADRQRTTGNGQVQSSC